MQEKGSIVIVGGTSGIGEAIAMRFLADGWRVGVAGRREDRLEDIASRFPNRIFIQKIDVTEKSSVSLLYELIEKMGGIDIFVLASGVGKQNLKLDEEIERNTVQTNVVGFTQMIDAAYRYFRDNHRKGRIGAISSIAGTKGLGVAASYSATKSYQATYLEALNQLSQMEGVDVTFTDIRPGFVKTDLLDDGKHYPMMLCSDDVADEAKKAILKGKCVKVIDWKYRVLVSFWRIIPRCLWVKLKIKN